MKAVILAGGLGTRLSEETSVRPKPMVEVGGKPILWHLINIYSAHGINEFIICCGYKGHIIKDYFVDYFHQHSDLLIDLRRNEIEYTNPCVENWKLHLIDTGLNTMTGGRLKRVAEYLDDETFCFTYGDGVGDVDITAACAFHRKTGAAATMTAVQPPGRFGAFSMRSDDDMVRSFREKPDGDGAWVNGGFFILEPEVIRYIDDDSCVWEQKPLEQLAKTGRLAAYRHEGFWHPMDTLRDKEYLQALWASNNAPWKIW